ncbi:oxysterol-binding protein-related protein 10-like isoform X2 [Fundulus heteroclitus]|uniref:oxysterol-binding protein-related protein 10-like isoform X2 n=1 Tax=Fundulus heteroclitus TaxID=8078 RepID=UPI00165A4C94|nr:oxysterol-binding protein-related protein 10-like isoform X2 [Fundulus heteroclitus]
MDKTLCSPGTNRTNSSSSSSSSPRKPASRSGSYSPGSGSLGGSAGAGGGRGTAQGSGVSEHHHHHHQQQQLHARRRQLEGVLSKYTNLIQGWQNRYFVLDPDIGQLQYFINEQGRTQKPRGSLPLIGASVTTSDEAPYMFVVHSVNGELYKLKASDAKEQQFWINQLQACARRHSDSSAKVRKLKSSDEHLSVDRAGGGQDVLVMSQAEGQQKNLVHSIDALPTKGPLSCLDQDLLLLKATSAATLSCLGECLNILQQTQSHSSQAPPQSHASQRSRGTPSDGVPVWTVPKSPSGDTLRNGGLTPSQSAEPSPALRKRSLSHGAEHHPGLEDISPSEEVTDTEDNEEEDLGVLDDQRSVILHLLSQLKLGMDLTRVVLPTFILEKRSLLEMYANFMAHPDMFLSITAGATAEDRIVRFVEYYLTAFHEGRKGAVAKKPYNPVLGETFHCSWEVPRDKVKPLVRSNLGPAREPGRGSNNSQLGEDSPEGSYRVRFVAEQVSHHPPVSGFYCECRERQMCVNAHVWTKSKFMGMSVGVSMVGEGVLCLLEHDEEYIFTLPCAYARSILTVPWVELGGKVSINCIKSGYSATVTFHTKPFYGGKVHRVTAEVKHNPTSTIVCKAQGEWNGTLEFTYSSGETKVIDTSKLPVTRKKLRPVERQGRTESRRLWQHVTKSLKEGNIDEATAHKHRLEESQRVEERKRAADNKPWKPKYFTKEGEGWIYNNPLWKST